MGEPVSQASRLISRIRNGQDYSLYRRRLLAALGHRDRLQHGAKIIIALSLFLVSFSVKSLHALDLSPLIYGSEHPAGGMTGEYDREAASILEGRRFIPENWDPSDTSLLVHAPGYSIFLSAIYKSLDRNYFTVQLVQNLVNSISPVLIFLIAGLLITWRVGIVSGALAAVFHHFGYYSNLILPDSICVIPLLAAVLLLIKARRDLKAAWWACAVAGLLIGVSVWLRPNALLMGPLFALLLPLVSIRRRQTAKRAWLIAIIPFLVIAPITIRNYMLYGELVLVSSNMGIVLWEGIADIGGHRFGAVSIDREVAEQEAVWYNDPRYAQAWHSPDGIKRDRDRIKRSLRVIAENPVWFARGVLWRMKEMVKYSAYAPLVFRSTDTKIIEEAEAARQQKQAAREKKRNRNRPEVRAERERSEQAQNERIESSRRFSLAFGESISWTRPVARFLQRTAKETALLFILLGAPVVFFLSPRRGAFIMLVPLYYLLVQSLMHTEFRYTLAMHYFLFIFAAIVWVLIGAALWSAASLIINRFRKRAIEKD